MAAPGAAALEGVRVTGLTLDELKFGTDGWRDVIAERFTMTNLARVAQAYAEHLTSEGLRRVLVGYDTRFLGRRFALRVGEVLAANGMEVAVSDEFLPTPVLSFAVKHEGADGGVMVTASHNPAEYSGFKLKGSYGGGAFDATYRDVAARAARIGPKDVATRGGAGRRLDGFDARSAYYRALDALVDVGSLRRAGVRQMHDAMGGAGAGWLKAYFVERGAGDLLVELRERPDPLFHGVNPEPIPANLAVTAEWMSSGAADGVSFAVCTDGDADRLGVMLPGGGYFNSHQIFATLIDDLARRGERGSVVKTFTVSRIVERLAAARGLPVIETKVGFKFVVDEMLKGESLIGGEESGGIGVAAHLFERDGLANALLLAAGVAESGVPLPQRFTDLQHELGWRHAYDRLDLALGSRAALARAAEVLDDPPGEVAGRTVTSVERLDGVKLNLADDAWVLVRPSGTEPLVRVYCEGPDPATVGTILRAVGALVGAPTA